MKTASIFLASCLCFTVFASAKGAIAYFNGPAFGISLDFEITSSIDFDRNGVADLSFSSGPALTTGDPGNYSITTYVSPSNSNSLLCNQYQAVVMQAGTAIGGLTSSNASWKNINGATLAEFVHNGEVVVWTPGGGLSTNAPNSGWGGPLANSGEGFLGVCFAAEDGLHYGWVHVALQSVPTIIDWAYETQPNTAIAAGAAPLAMLKKPQIIRPGNLRLEWGSGIGTAYQVQFKRDLGALTWTNVGFTIISTANTTAVDVPLSETTGFLRVVQAQ